MTDEVDQQELAEQLLAQAKEQGVDLVGPSGPVNASPCSRAAATIAAAAACSADRH